MEETSIKKESLIAIGRISKPQGLRGEVRITPLTDFPERFKLLQSLLLCKQNQVQTKTIEAVRFSNKFIVLKFHGVDTRTDAESLVGWTLNVEGHQIVDLPEDTFFIHDVVESAVFSEDQTFIGTVEDVYQLPGNDVLVVRNKENGKEHLIPVAEAFLKEVDLKEKKIIVHVIDGLLD